MADRKLSATLINERRGKPMKKLLTYALLITLIIFACTALSAYAQEDSALQETSPTQSDNSAVTTDTATQISFSDIPEDAPYKDAVYKLVENGVLEGYPDGTFRPNGNLTRAEMCKMINLTFGYTDTADAAGFPDLDTNEWYMPYVLAAQKAGYVLGDEGTGNFRPNDNITRQEVCVILYRIIKPYEFDLPITISDEVPDWAKKYVEAIVKNGIIPLEENNTFRATEPIRRFELASALAPYSTRIEPVKCTLTFVDGDKTETKQVEIGNTLDTFPTAQNAPEGYVFAGWSLSKDEEVIVDSEFVFLEDKTLYAVYKKQTFTVRFMVDSTLLVSTQTVAYGESPTLPYAPSKSGYTFKGWAVGTSSSVVDVEKYQVKEAVVFNAVFEKQPSGGGNGGGTTVTITYSVKFVSEGKTLDTQKVERGKYAKEISNPEKSGYVFKYWSLEENGSKTDVSSYAIKQDTTFYAVFELSEENENDPEIIAALESALEQFRNIPLSTKNQRDVRTIVVSTVEEVLEDAASGVFIDADYVKTEYEDKISQVEDIVKNVMSEAERSEFITYVRNNVDDDTFNLLTDYFLDGESLEDYL